MAISLPRPGRRQLLGAAAALAACWQLPARAQAFPSRPITVINPFAAGGITDLMARLLSPRLTAQLGQPIVVDSKPGAGAAIGAVYVARSAPDGHTLLLGSSTAFTINPHLNAKLPYDPFRDFVPVSSVLSVPNVLVAKPGFAAHNLSEFIALAKDKPGKLTYGSYGNGTSTHLIMEHLKHEAGIDVLHVPYKNGSTAVMALLGGEVDVSFDSLYGAMPRIKAGQVMPLAMMQPERSPGLPNVMSTTDAGYGKVGYTAWLAFFVPAATPPAVVQALSAAVRSAVEAPEVRAKLAEMGCDPLLLSNETFGRMLRAESEQMRSIITLAKIKVE